MIPGGLTAANQSANRVSEEKMIAAGERIKTPVTGREIARFR